MHPLIDPFAGSRDEATELISAHVRSSFPVATRLALSWHGEVGLDLCVIFAWFQTARELMREPDVFVRRRGLELLNGTLDGAISGRGPISNDGQPGGALALALPLRLQRHGITPLSLRSSLEESISGLNVGALSSRTELLAHAARLVHPEVLAYARVLGRDDERSFLEAQALGEGIQLVRWLVNAPGELRLGRLRFAGEDVARFRVELASIKNGDDTPAGRDLSRAQAEWAGGLIAKGWTACERLGWARGRALAALLRWQVAELAALEERHFAPGTPPPAGWTRVAACSVAAIATRQCARW